MCLKFVNVNLPTQHTSEITQRSYLITEHVSIKFMKYTHTNVYHKRTCFIETHQARHITLLSKLSKGRYCSDANLISLWSFFIAERSKRWWDAVIKSLIARGDLEWKHNFAGLLKHFACLHKLTNWKVMRNINGFFAQTFHAHL